MTFVSSCTVSLNLKHFISQNLSAEFVQETENVHVDVMYAINDTFCVVIYFIDAHNTFRSRWDQGMWLSCCFAYNWPPISYVNIMMKWKDSRCVHRFCMELLYGNYYMS